MTYERPMTADLLIARAAKSGVKISDTALREIMNHLRKKKRPVGSTTKGYFGILHSVEFNVAIDHLVTRARDLEEQIREMKEAQQDMFKMENSLSPNLAGRELTEAFELVPA